MLSSSHRDNDFSCSMQTPMIDSCLLYPGCYMTTRSGYASCFVMDTNVLSTFNIAELPYEASITSLCSSALYQLPAEIQVSAFPNRSPQRAFPLYAAFGGLMAAPVSRHWKVTSLYCFKLCYNILFARSTHTN